MTTTLLAHPPAADRPPGLLRRHPVVAALLAVLLLLVATWGVRLVQVGLGVERARTYWSVPRGEPGGLLYVALGDSAAQGVGASRPERGYVGLLAERMRRQSGRPVLVVNLSRSGATVQDVVAEQLPRLRALSPDVVTVAVGGNDVRAWDPVAFARSTDLLTAGLPRGAYVADVPSFMHEPWERRSDGAARTMARSARAHGLEVVPLHAALRAAGARSMLTDFAADAFHPNDRGHRRWADALWDRVSSAPALARRAQVPT